MILRTERPRPGPAECEHTWASNSGRGGPAKYSQGRIRPTPVMQALCQKCLVVALFDRESWEALPLARDVAS